MKLQTTQPAFQPINIVIETKEELQFFTALLGAVSTNDMKAFGVADSDIYHQLSKALNYDSANVGFITRLDKRMTDSQVIEDFSEVKSGTVILVRDSEDEEWVERKFMHMEGGGMYVCEHSERGKYSPIPWKMAKIIH